LVLKVEYLDAKNVWLVTVDDDLDLYTVPDLRKTVNECMSKKETDFIFDCSDMGFIDSTGLGELASLMKTVNIYEGSITIKGLKSHIKKVFFITGLNTIFNIDGEADE
jgi:anti-sigma B factor antagonist